MRIVRNADVVAQIVLAGVAVALASTFFGAYAFDDSYIGYSIAKNLARGLGFTFDPGIRILSTSAPLAPLVYAAIARLTGADIVAIAQVWSLLAYFVLGPLSFRVLRTWASPMGAFLGALSILTSPFVLMLWSHESLLCLVLSAFAVTQFTQKRYAVAAIAFGFAVLLRQEASFAIAACCIAMWRSAGLFAALRFAAIAASPMAIWALYAIPTFGTIFSRTMEVKVVMGKNGGNDTFLSGIVDYASLAFWNDYRSYRGGIAILIAAAATAAFAYRARPRSAPLAAGIAVVCVLQCLMYVGLQVAFFVWFCVPVAILIAVAISLPWATARDRTAGAQTYQRTSIAFASLLVVVHVVFAARIATGGFPPDAFVGRFPGAHIKTSGFVRLGGILAATLPTNASIMYPEPGQLRYYSDRTIIDSQGLTHPGSVDYYAAGHPEWTIERYHPSYVLEDDAFGTSPHLAWFNRAYRLQPERYVVGTRRTRSRFRMYRLENPQAIPNDWRQSH